MNSQYNDTDDDDLPLHPRGNRGETYVHEAEVSRLPEREVTLNTGIVLGIFFALALLCAVFFGFGYSIGHKSAPQVASSPEPEVTTTVDTPVPAVAKPSVATTQPVPGYVPAPGSRPATTPAKPSAATVTVESKPTRGNTAVVAVAPARPVTAVHSETSASPTTDTAPPTTGTIYVQVAAVSHKEDADVLLNALRRKGYMVHPRSDAADQLIHVQVGPFSTRKEADAMRQRLAGDGYNGFIK